MTLFDCISLADFLGHTLQEDGELQACWQNLAWASHIADSEPSSLKKKKKGLLIFPEAGFHVWAQDDLAPSLSPGLWLVSISNDIVSY